MGGKYPGLLLQVLVEKLCLADAVLESGGRLAFIDVSSGLLREQPGAARLIERIRFTSHHRMPLLFALEACLGRLAVDLRCEGAAKRDFFSDSLPLVVESAAHAGLLHRNPALGPPVAHRIHGSLSSSSVIPSVGGFSILALQRGRLQILSKLLELQLQVILAKLQARPSAAKLRTVTVLHASLLHCTASCSHLIII